MQTESKQKDVQASRFRFRQLGGFAIPAGDTTIPFNLLDYDALREVNVAVANTFVPIRTGFYAFFADAVWQNPLAGVQRFTLRILEALTGNISHMSRLEDGTANDQRLHCSGTQYLTVGQRVYVIIFNGGAARASTGAGCIFSGFRFR